MGFWPSTLGPSDFQTRPVPEREPQQKGPQDAGEPPAAQTTEPPVEGNDGTVLSPADETTVGENTE